MTAQLPVNETIFYQALQQVIDPELGCNIVDLGLIYDIRFEGTKVIVLMTLTTPGCPMQESMSWGVKCALLNLDGVDDVDVDVVWDPPWHPSMMTDAGRAATGAGSF